MKKNLRKLLTHGYVLKIENSRCEDQLTMTYIVFYFCVKMVPLHIDAKLGQHKS